MNVFNRQHQGLLTVGFAEVAAGIYPLIDRMAHLIAHHLQDLEKRPESAAAFRQYIATDDFDVRGGKQFVASDRHANYVDLASYFNHTDELCHQFGWPLLSEINYSSSLRLSTPS